MGIKKFIENRYVKKMRKQLLLNVTKIMYEYLLFDYTILDLGCGENGSLDYEKVGGNFNKELPITLELLGLDKSKERVSLFNERYKNIGKAEIFDMDKDKIKGKFDLIISSGVIQYLEDYKSFLKEINNSLEEGGIFIISTINKDSSFRRIGLMRKGIKEGEKNIFNLQELKQELENSNFKIIKEEGSDIFPIKKELCSNIILVGEKR